MGRGEGVAGGIVVESPIEPRPASVIPGLGDAVLQQDGDRLVCLQPAELEIGADERVGKRSVVEGAIEPPLVLIGRALIVLFPRVEADHASRQFAWDQHPVEIEDVAQPAVVVQAHCDGVLVPVKIGFGQRAVDDAGRAADADERRIRAAQYRYPLGVVAVDTDGRIEEIAGRSRRAHSAGTRRSLRIFPIGVHSDRRRQDVCGGARVVAARSTRIHARNVDQQLVGVGGADIFEKGFGVDGNRCAQFLEGGIEPRSGQRGGCRVAGVFSRIHHEG